MELVLRCFQPIEYGEPKDNTRLRQEPANKRVFSQTYELVVLLETRLESGFDQVGRESNRLGQIMHQRRTAEEETLHLAFGDTLVVVG